MPRRTHIEPHLSLAELEKKIKSSREPVARQQMKVILLLMKGLTQKEVAHRCNYSAAWVHTIVRRYNEQGVKALRDHRRDNPGRPYRLSGEVRAEMKKLLEQPPQKGGLWTGPLLVEWVRERTGDDTIDSKRGWEWLKQLGCKDRLKRRVKSPKQKKKVQLEKQKDVVQTSHGHEATAAS